MNQWKGYLSWILALLLWKFIWKLHWPKYALLTKGRKVLFYINNDERDVLCRYSAAIFLSFWLERASISSHCKGCLQVFLSYTAIMLNIAIMYPMQKASSLPKNSKTLLLSLAISDFDAGLFAQPFYTFWSSGFNWRTLAAMLIKCWLLLAISFCSLRSSVLWLLF